MAIMQSAEMQQDTGYAEHAALHNQVPPERAPAPSTRPAPAASANAAAPIKTPQNQGRAVNNQQTKTSGEAEFQKPEYQHHVYGGQAAFEIRTSQTRGDEPKHTVSFDFAAKINKDKVNWGDKLIFQATQTELFELCALFLGYQAEGKFEFHDHKTMFVKWQPDGNLVLTLMKGKQKFTVAVSTGYDRMCCLNTCLYSLAMQLKIPRTEARTQVMALCRPTPNANAQA